MFLPLVTLLVALFALGIPLLQREFPAVLGCIRATGASERWSVKFLLPLLVAAGLLAPFFLAVHSRPLLWETVPSCDLPSVIAVCVGTVAAIMISTVIHRWTAVPYAFMGSILGCQLMVNGHLDQVHLWGLIGSWVAAPLLCCLLCTLLSWALHRYASRGGRHLAVVDQRLLAGSVLASILLVAAWSWNLAPITALFPRLVLGSGTVPAFLTLGVLFFLFLLHIRSVRAHTVSLSENDLDFGASYLLAILLSMTVCFGLFSWDGIARVGLQPTPLSACALLVAALAGVSFSRRDAVIAGSDIVQSVASCTAAPLLGILITYCLSIILDVSPEESGSTGWSSRLIPTLILVGIAVMSAAIYFYVRVGQSESRRRQILQSREEQVYSTQKSLSALEVRVETHEKDLLNKLDIKRKELVDFAVGVSEQKAFMEQVYASLARAKELPSGPAKDAALEEILSDLRQRMYFTREMNDFYARTEVLHRDFNMRLKEAFPELTESERKLANLLRQGFSSKYIASLMNITPKSVEISRYRLRTKLGLKRSDNLVQYIKSI
jgi:DNA-binding CsgD family transcriptional regulator